MPEGPAAVWDLLRRADDFVRFAQNRRDPGVSYAQARALLDEAEQLVETMSVGQAEFFHAQIALRRGELDTVDRQ